MKKIIVVLLSLALFFTLTTSHLLAEDWDHLVTQKIFTSEKKLVFLNCYYFIDSPEENKKTKEYCDMHVEVIRNSKAGFKENQDPMIDVFFTDKNPDGMREIYLVEVGGYLKSSHHTIKSPNATTITNKKTGSVDYFFSYKDEILIILLTQEQEEK